jgi:ubiquinone/menaquinone biosynthesis C-methylase UbiE
MDFVKNTIEAYDKIAEEYSKTWGDIDLIKKYADLFLRFLKGRKILDVGCGPGRDSKYFSEKGLEVIGIDLSENFLKIARMKAPSVKFLKMDLRKLDFPNETFDGLWVCSSFLHIPKKDAKKTLKEFRRVLKKEGVMFIAVKQGKGEKIKEGIYNVFYNKEEFEKLIRSMDFNIKKSCINKEIWIIVFAEK